MATREVKGEYYPLFTILVNGVSTLVPGQRVLEILVDTPHAALGNVVRDSDGERALTAEERNQMRAEARSMRQHG